MATGCAYGGDVKTTYGANFYLTFEAEDDEHAKKVAQSIVDTHDCARDAAYCAFETLLPVEECTNLGAGLMDGD